MAEKKFKLIATISSDNPLAIKPVLERIIDNDGTIKAKADGFEVAVEFTGVRARD